MTDKEMCERIIKAEADDYHIYSDGSITVVDCNTSIVTFMLASFGRPFEHRREGHVYHPSWIEEKEV